MHETIQYLLVVYTCIDLPYAQKCLHVATTFKYLKINASKIVDKRFIDLSKGADISMEVSVQLCVKHEYDCNITLMYACNYIIMPWFG